jgi:shikimate kinase
MTDNIVLIGFMGVGKGRTARELARQTGRFAVDSDDLIESLVKMKIADIFAAHGEPYFRALEGRVAQWLGECVSATIVSTGGGFAAAPDVGRIGTVVHLHSEFDEIIAAIKGHPRARQKIKKRPLLQDLDRARRLYDQRRQLYLQVADLQIDVTGRPVSLVAEEIIERTGLKISFPVSER